MDQEIKEAAERLRARSVVTVLTPRRGAPLSDLRYAMFIIPGEREPVVLSVDEIHTLVLLAEQGEVELVLPFMPSL